MVFGSIVMEFKDNIECNKTIPSFLIYKCSWLQVKRHIFPLWHFRRIKTKTKKFCCCYVWVEDVEANLKECTRKSNSCTDEFFFQLNCTFLLFETFKSLKIDVLHNFIPFPQLFVFTGTISFGYL